MRLCARLGRTWLVLLGLSAFLLPATAGAAPPKKSFDVQVPATIPAGVTRTLSVTVTNNASQSLGSMRVTLPSTLTTTSPTFFTTLGIAPGTSRTFTFDTTAQCTSAAASNWTFEVKQSNDFSGTGNDFTQPPTGNRATAVTDNCSLTWTTAPHGAKIGDQITGTDFDTAGPAPVVTLRNAEGGPLAGRSVSLGLGLSTGIGGLTGATSPATTDVNGNAAFPGGSIGAPGVYRFAATSPGVPASTGVSDPFPVQTLLRKCTAATDTCSDSLAGDLASVDVVADPSTTSSAGYVTASIFSSTAPTCTGYRAFSSRWAVVLVSAGRTKTATYNIAAGEVPKGNVALHWCYGEPAPSAAALQAFLANGTPWWSGGVLAGTAAKAWDSDGDGVPDGATWVLNTCGSPTPVRPCENRSWRNGSGGHVEALLASGADDPMGRS
jgi:hypothetical protein